MASARFSAEAAASGGPVRTASSANSIMRRILAGIGMLGDRRDPYSPRHRSHPAWDLAAIAKRISLNS